MAWFEYGNAGNSEAQQLQAQSFLFAQVSTGKAATGVLTGLSVSQTTTASASVVVAAGSGVVQAATLDGASLVGDVQDTTLDVLTGSPMGAVPRNDIVVADQATGSIRVIIGSPNVTPTDPTVPASAIPLARISNAANATTVPASAITDLRTFTTLNVGSLNSAWTAYTPTWETNGVFPLVGNGSLTGRYKDVGKTRFVHVEFVRGSTTQAGNDNYTFGLPPGTYQSFRVSGSGYYMDNSPFTEQPVTVRGISNGKVALLLPSGGRVRYNTVTWAMGDEIVFDVTIELA